MGNPKSAASKVGQARKRQKTGGRTAGTPNKATTEFRQTVAALLEKNAKNVAVWLEQVASGTPASEGVKEIPPAPEKALDLLAKLAEYAAPKLARTEHVGDGGGDIGFTVNAPWLQQQVQKRNS
jgi:hypothetical protein